MNHEHVAALLDFAATIDRRVRPTTPQHAAATITAWTTALRDVPTVATAVGWDVVFAVRGYYERKGGDQSAQFRPIGPADILAAWAPRRAELMSRHVAPTPTADPDDVPAYLAEIRADRAAVSTGRATPVEQRQLTRREPPEEITARVTATGSPIPPDAQRELALYRNKRNIGMRCRQP
ncbi:hypothetical protein GO001_23500 [Streptomyces sp. NRRL B-1677]|uniref:hypothetical protein n=1 Tax=Streptomyces sp. NRRL B-1677 TaxID=2682966 RepID=UPI001892C879|nr:hypothetical protein [Streptomyces sp. NRRL B-1677]MBF6048143.1 hypothetical protein [Streptomyces sp. NRRL B-1677]